MNFANIVENDFLPEHLTLLGEYGIPHSAIKKLQRNIPNNITDEDLVDYIKRTKLYQVGYLIDYEKEKLKTLF